MSFFEKAKEFVGITGQKTEEVINVQKLRFSAAALTNKISMAYEKLGKLYYQSLKNNTNIEEQSSKIILEIESMNGELKELKSKIAELKGSVVCSNCNNTVSDSFEFCPKCGAKIDK